MSVGFAVECLKPWGGSTYDPFLGSGTTMVAAEQLGRVCRGIEISPAYCAVALQRMKDLGLDPQLAEGKA
jgi:DNA modification methylase